MAEKNEILFSLRNQNWKKITLKIEKVNKLFKNIATEKKSLNWTV